MKKQVKSENESTHVNSREFFTVAQLADLFRLNPMTVYRLVKTGELSGYQIGRIMRFRRDDIEEFLSRSRVAPGKIIRH